MTALFDAAMVIRCLSNQRLSVTDGREVAIRVETSIKVSNHCWLDDCQQQEG